ncbi:hypothetical protein ACVWXQ_001802 [Bradyrhizobium sp. S3.14.4]
MLGAMAAANAACDQTTDSTSGVTINFTSVGQIYRLCLTVGAAAADDSVVYGVYSVAGTDAFYNAPIANSTGHSGSPLLTAADYNPTTSKATYTFHPTNPNQNGQSAKAGQAEIDITLNSKTGGGQDSITLYYTPGCSDFNVGCSGSSIANTPYTFTINLPSPTVTSISPTTGPLAGGTSVVITGANFTGTTGAGGVKFGATNATSYTVNSNTQITATAPAGSAGTVDVTVTNGSTSPTSAADQFTYVAPPTVTAISPTSGPTGGGTSVIITGTNFSTTTGAAGVKFGAINAASYTVNSNTQITATSPAGTGTVDVTVTTVGGTSATTASDQFTYVGAPTVTSISPTSGPGAGGTTVTITGTNFSGATAVVFGAAAATGVTVNSATQITATSPAGTSTIDIRVTTAGGTSATSAADQFTYIASPIVTSISPTAGPQTGGTVVTITGTNFTGVTAVSFGGTAATGFTFNSATSITATSPPGTGAVDVRVTTPGGTSATSAADQFTYAGPPSITSISPTGGPLGGGTIVTITGSNLSGATAVTFGATAAAGFTVNSATQITATSPAGTGTVDIRVTTVGGTSATSAADQFTYTAAPTVTSISPTTGPQTGGTVVTVTGTGFTGATAVTFGATAATSFTVSSSTSITATSPAGTSTVDLRVTNPGGTSATSAADQFTYVATPAVTSLSPTSGPAAGGTGGNDHGHQFHRRDSRDVRCNRGGGLHRQLRNLDHRDIAGRHRYRRRQGDDHGRHLGHIGGRPVHLRRHASRHVAFADVGAGGRRHGGNDHGHQFHRRDSRDVRCNRGGGLHRQLRNLDHRDIAGRHRYRRRQGDDHGRHLGDIGGRPVHLFRRADRDVDLADGRPARPAARR